MFSSSWQYSHIIFTIILYSQNTVIFNQKICGGSQLRTTGWQINTWTLRQILGGKQILPAGNRYKCGGSQSRMTMWKINKSSIWEATCAAHEEQRRRSHQWASLLGAGLAHLLVLLLHLTCHLLPALMVIPYSAPVGASDDKMGDVSGEFSFNLWSLQILFFHNRNYFHLMTHHE